MTTFLQLLIDQGIKVKSVNANNGWLEFYTIDDIELYSKLAEDKKLSVHKNGKLSMMCQLFLLINHKHVY